MADATFLLWPFLDSWHGQLAGRIREWAATITEDEPDERSLHDTCRSLVREHGDAGWLRYSVTAPYGGEHEQLDVRAICIARESLAYRSGLADFTFAMQGLGCGPITLFGSEDQKQQYLPRVATGESIAAFAISESHAGSDLRAMRTTARRHGGDWILSGEKSWISNAGIADFYVVFAKTPELGERAYGAFIVDSEREGVDASTRVAVSAPHPLGTLRLHDCRVPASAVIGAPDAGMSVALGTLDVFRATVGAAALGLARRALDEAVAYTTSRAVTGAALSDLQLTQARLADMATDVDTSALLVYRAAWTKDKGAARVTREAAMAKMHATEAAQRVVDSAVQLFGARGVVTGSVVERLYREVRALRIYEGTTEIQKLVIAGQLTREAPTRKSGDGA